ncbi:MAG: TonB-dependent receptor [Pseudomonadota bacterium]
MGKSSAIRGTKTIKANAKAASLVTLAVFLADAPCVSAAENEVLSTLEEVVVVGTRRDNRTAIDTPVPVDVFNRENINSVASDDMLEVIQTLVPSFQVQRYPSNDGATFIRPPTLRGMSADKILVLVNGKRRHRSALVQLSGDGVHGPDLATIPDIAVDTIEVLRDGASALYGSDAIAGVLNFNLRDAAEGGEVRLQRGIYTEGNEDSYILSLNKGFSLSERGFLNVSAEYSDNEATSRGTTYTLGGFSTVDAAQTAGFFDHDNNAATPAQQRFGPDALTEVFDTVSGELLTLARGSDGIPDDTDTRYADNLRFAEVSNSQLAQIWGAPEREAFASFVNAGFELSGGQQIYGWANYSHSDSDGSFFYRAPGNNALVPLRTESGDIYNPRDIYPAGFTPRFAGEVTDIGVVLGVNGVLDNGLSFDMGGRWGENEIEYTIFNTLNPSLGPGSPTSFRPGGAISDESALFADFAIPFDIGVASDLNVAFGLEFREESYETVAGEPLSYEIGPFAFPDPFNFEIDADEAAAGQNGGSVGCFIPGPQFDTASLCDPRDPIHNVAPIGSNGFPGFLPSFSPSYSRDSAALYLDLEADFTDRFMAALAVRYEDFSDFGSNLSWRLAARYQVSDAWVLRGSASTGFRAPTPGQISSISVQTAAIEDEAVTRGIFPPDNPASQLFGATPLQDETSKQFTLGLAFQPFDALIVTLDYYHIALDDRIWISSNFSVGPEERAELISIGAPGADQLNNIRFFTNDMDTETNGVDLVAQYLLDWSAGSTLLSFAANYNDTRVTRRTNRQTDPTNPTPLFFLSDADVFRLEEGTPQFRANATATHRWSPRVSTTLRANVFGDYKFTNNSASRFQDMSGGVYWDVDVNWQATDEVEITLGGRNVFNAAPDRQPEFFSCCGLRRDRSSILDWQGPYFYLRGVYSWN